MADIFKDFFETKECWPPPSHNNCLNKVLIQEFDLLSLLQFLSDLKSTIIIMGNNEMLEKSYSLRFYFQLKLYK